MDYGVIIYDQDFCKNNFLLLGLVVMNSELSILNCLFKSYDYFMILQQ